MFFQKEKIYFGFFIYMEGIMNKENKKRNKKKGFTLIEILVVVLIIGVLAAIALPSYMRSVERSRATGPMTNLGSIAKAQKAYRMGTEHYTDNVGNLDISLKDETNGEDANGSTFESEFFTYKVYGDDKAAATATRKNVDEDKKYELSVDYNTNKIYCRPIENKTCIDLGLEEGQDYADSENNNGPWVDCNEDHLRAIANMHGHTLETLQGYIDMYSSYGLNICKTNDNGGMKVCGYVSSELTGEDSAYMCFGNFLYSDTEYVGFACKTSAVNPEECNEYLNVDEYFYSGSSYFQAFCYGSDNIDGDAERCSNYDEMYEYYNYTEVPTEGGHYSYYDKERHCEEFVGRECVSWSEWQEGNRY